MKNVQIIFLLLAIGASKTDWAQDKLTVIRLEPSLDEIVSSDSKVEQLAGNLGFLEGLVWVRKGGYLLFSDIPANAIKKWSSGDGKITTFLEPSGFTGPDATGIGRQNTNGHDVFFEIGSNGATMDRLGRIVFSAMGDRQIVRLEKNGQRTVLASRYDGKRLNSTNDLVFKSDGSLYFTDPDSVLRLGDKDPQKEIPFAGVYLLKSGRLQLLTKELIFPNGLAFTPDEKHLYVNDSAKKTIMRYDVQPDDTIANGTLFVDMSDVQGVGIPNGMKVDRKGNVYCTGPAGIWVLSPEGKHLGTLVFPERPANFTFGDTDAKTLYVGARSGLYRIRVKIPGIRP